VQDAPVHRLQAVIDVGNGAFEDDVTGVVEKPVAIKMSTGLCSTGAADGRMGEKASSADFLEDFLATVEREKEQGVRE
jgi:hypothetical protein